ncbi:hypothetical protein BT67DRAFT_101501 [Trichocladium antarcticum]|uniref:Uncharacterized protein n=1 Tax=Trichocladium antarcticum TaxID=1450529 RepID=A0AAN6ZH24_9PEZI|nr:hypothetical protein BT67DRAFT_101501 [Trichocladium antarcticum]
MDGWRGLDGMEPHQKKRPATTDNRVRDGFRRGRNRTASFASNFGPLRRGKSVKAHVYNIKINTHTHTHTHTHIIALALGTGWLACLGLGIGLAWVRTCRNGSESDGPAARARSVLSRTPRSIRLDRGEEPLRQWTSLTRQRGPGDSPLIYTVKAPTYLHSARHAGLMQFVFDVLTSNAERN